MLSTERSHAKFAAATLLGGILDLCSDRAVEIAVIIGIAGGALSFISRL